MVIKLVFLIKAPLLFKNTPTCTNTPVPQACAGGIWMSVFIKYCCMLKCKGWGDTSIAMWTAHKSSIASIQIQNPVSLTTVLHFSLHLPGAQEGWKIVWRCLLCVSEEERKQTVFLHRGGPRGITTDSVPGLKGWHCVSEGEKLCKNQGPFHITKV